VVVDEEEGVQERETKKERAICDIKPSPPHRGEEVGTFEELI